MTSALDFVIVSDVVQVVPGLAIGPNAEPVVHHATIKRRNKEYVVVRAQKSNKIYIEEVERNRATFALKEIESDAEWADVVRFCEAAGLLSMSTETKYGN